MPVAAPADKRFRRAQVKPARRRRSWSRWLAIGRGLLALAVLTFGAYQATLLVAQASALHVSKVVVRGNHRLSHGEVLALMEGVRGEHILRTDLDVWHRRVLGSPWVESAALRRVLPSTIEVTVNERRPMALCRVGDGVYLVDQTGLIIDEFGPDYAHLDLPIVRGLAPSPDRGRPALDETRAALAERLIAAVHRDKALFGRISEIDVEDAHDAVVLLDGDPALLHLGDERFLERLQNYQDLAPALRERVPEIEYVDLRFEHRVYVRPVGSAGPRNGSGLRR